MNVSVVFCRNDLHQRLVNHIHQSIIYPLDMVKLGLFVKAELDGVTGLTPVDTVQNPYFYTFKVLCNSCHEVNDNWITISRQVNS
jgi:Eukaryotic protein of unknown function (DUF866)